MTIEEKYNKSIDALKQIANKKGNGPHGSHNEWTEAAAFDKCRRIARYCLTELNELHTETEKAAEE